MEKTLTGISDHALPERYRSGHVIVPLAKSTPEITWIKQVLSGQKDMESALWTPLEVIEMEGASHLVFRDVSLVSLDQALKADNLLSEPNEDFLSDLMQRFSLAWLKGVGQGLVLGEFSEDQVLMTREKDKWVPFFWVNFSHEAKPVAALRTGELELLEKRFYTSLLELVYRFMMKPPGETRLEKLGRYVDEDGVVKSISADYPNRLKSTVYTVLSKKGQNAGLTIRRLEEWARFFKENNYWEQLEIQAVQSTPASVAAPREDQGGHPENSTGRKNKWLLPSILFSLIFLSYGVLWVHAFSLIRHEYDSGRVDQSDREYLNQIAGFLPSVGIIKTFKQARILYRDQFQMVGPDHILRNESSEELELVEVADPSRCTLRLRSLVRISPGVWVIHASNGRCTVWDAGQGICPEPVFEQCVVRADGSVQTTPSK